MAGRVISNVERRVRATADSFTAGLLLRPPDTDAAELAAYVVEDESMLGDTSDASHLTDVVRTKVGGKGSRTGRQCRAMYVLLVE